MGAIGKLIIPAAAVVKIDDLPQGGKRAVVHISSGVFDIAQRRCFKFAHIRFFLGGIVQTGIIFERAVELFMHPFGILLKPKGDLMDARSRPFRSPWHP